MQDGEVLHGGVGVIVPVLRDAGTAVIKVSFPHPGNDFEPDAFAAWGGRGAVLLYERDDSQYGMLLERVESSTLAEVEDSDEVASVAGRISRRLAIPAAAGLPRLKDEAGAWEEQLLRDAAELEHPMPAYVVDAALATIRELATVQPEVLIHGDFHARNILRAEREDWLAVDPKGYVGDPAYDAGNLLRVRAVLNFIENDDGVKLAHRFLDIYTEAAEIDREQAQRWSQLLLVQGAFWGRRHGFRRARSGSSLDRITAFAGELATLLS
ncbi:aminoglycoside phosphotransferase family protein [Kribbella sp. NPDC006257]|uniref:aminoglycoside phosphotransferase family protein n=1 Tax=Kribbella sp. NPDC006257 TaxID=3156738 RepID=UPI0033A997C7